MEDGEKSGIGKEDDVQLARPVHTHNGLHGDIGRFAGSCDDNDIAVPACLAQTFFLLNGPPVFQSWHYLAGGNDGDVQGGKK